jgi:histone H3/H4
VSDAAAPATREMLIVQSKVREEIRKKDLRVSEDFLNALNEEIYALIEKSIARCNGNRRKTLDKSDV